MAETIVPRWEWRTFGQDFGKAEARIAESGPAKVRTSSETYVVSRLSGSNTKVRDGLMDIKRLQQANADGLEQWCPIMKAGFPLEPMVLLDVFRAWSVPMPKLQRPSYSYDEFVRELVRPGVDLRAIEVEKERHGFTIDGCIVEIANLRFDGAPVRTVAVEMEDPQRVIATVRALGLDRFDNVNYVRALKRSVGIADERCYTTNGEERNR